MGAEKKMKPAQKEKCKHRGGRAAPVLAAVLFLAGAFIFFYPAVSNYFAEKNQAVVIQDYQQIIEERDTAFLEEEWAKAEAYNENLAGDPVKDPFVPGSGYALPENYSEILNIDGVMGYVEIPEISVLLPIYHGTTEEVLEKGIGHIESTALPIGGEYRHTVLTGHRGLPSAELFSRLDELDVGDVFLIHVLGETLAYQVDQIKTVLPTELEDIQAVRGMDLATLLTCTPYGVNTHRLLVRGQRTAYVPGEAQAKSTAGLLASRSDVCQRCAGIILGLLLLFLLVVLLLPRKLQRARRKGGHHGKR